MLSLFSWCLVEGTCSSTLVAVGVHLPFNIDMLIDITFTKQESVLLFTLIQRKTQNQMTWPHLKVCLLRWVCYVFIFSLHVWTPSKEQRISCNGSSMPSPSCIDVRDKGWRRSFRRLIRLLFDCYRCIYLLLFLKVIADDSRMQCSSQHFVNENIEHRAVPSISPPCSDFYSQIMQFLKALQPKQKRR